MKKRNPIRLFLPVALLFCLVALLSACGGKVSYQVSVVDALGNPFTQGVTVEFLREDTQAGIQPVNKQGIAEMELAQGAYTVQLHFAAEADRYSYSPEDLQLTAEEYALTVTVYRLPNQENQTLYVDDSEYTAYFVEPGHTQLTLDGSAMSYVLFRPREAGEYEISLTGADVALGYYGTPFFVLPESITPAENNTLRLAVQQDQTETELVLGVGAGEGKAVLAITRTGGVPEQEMPWDTQWLTGHPETEACKVEIPNRLKYFDLAAKSGEYDLYYDEELACYRLKKNGPVVLVALGKNKNSACPAIGLFERVNGNGLQGGAGVVRYFYDKEGKLVKRESYTDFLLQAFAHAGITAYDQEVYHPLTKDLMYVLQNGFAQWWDPESPDYQAVFEGANPEYAWLFACCYPR